MESVKTEQAQTHELLAISEADMQLLEQAYWRLEHPSLAARLSNVVGTPIEVAMQLLPRSWYRRLHQTAEKAIGKAYDSAILSLRRPHESSSHDTYYKALVAGSGAVSGLLGLPGLALELPVTTTLMLRSIAEIARDEGEDIHELETRAACLEVFALGGPSEEDDAAETGYYSVRLALAGYMYAAVSHVGAHGLHGETAPILVKLIHAVASNFGLQLSRRAAAQLLPVVSAAAAATLNTVFLQHFQEIARSHFTVRRLERRYGAELVKANYENFVTRAKAAS
ncbi:MAG: EcsC family protein [Chromatiales bacterium]